MKRASCLLLFPLLFSLYSCSRDPKVVAKKYVDNGNKYFDKQKYKEASIMYRRALQSDVKSGEAWYHLGLADLRLRNGSAAMHDFVRATEVDGDIGKAYIRDAYSKLGDIYMYSTADAKNRMSAITELRKLETELQNKELLKREPKSFDSLRFAGFLAQTENKISDAISDYQQANQLKPDQPEVVLPLAGLLFNSQPDLAIQYCRNLIAKNKTLSQPYDLLYAHYAQTKQPGPAEQILKEKIANNPGQGIYLLELASFYGRSNRNSDLTATLARLTSDSKTYPNAHLLVGDFYLSQARDLGNAIQQYQQGLKDDPKQKAQYQKRLIQVLSAENKNDEAAKIVADLLKENPKDPQAIALHAATLLQSGKRDQIKTVISELQPLVAKTPTDSALHNQLGLAYQANYRATRDKTNLESARMQFQEAMNLRKDYYAAMLGLAEVELELGNNRKAVDTAAVVMDRTHNFKATLVHSVGLMNLGERDKARQELSMILQQIPGSQDARFQLASLDLAERRFKEAQDGFEILHKAADPRGLIGLVEVKVAQGDLDGAIAMAREQLKQTPDRLEYQLAVANIEFRGKKFSDAANDFQKLIDKNPKGVDLYLRLGEARRYSGDINAAEAAFKKARDLAPTDIMPLLQLGLLYDTTGRNSEARKTYEEVLKIKPDDPVALNNLAYAIADEGADLDQALNYVQRAQQKLPQDSDVMDTLGLIYLRKNLTDDGVRLLKEIVARNPKRSTYHLHLAMGYYQQGNRAAARKELEAATSEKPSEKEQVRIKEMKAKVG